MQKNETRKLVISALCLAMGLVLKRFTTVMIPIMGVGGLQVGLSGLFTMLPAILFGPVYGALVSGLNDMIGTFLRPDFGAWQPWFTVVALLTGFLRGLFWRAFKNADEKALKYLGGAFFGLLTLFGAAALCTVRFAQDSSFAAFLGQLTTKSGSQQFYATYLPLFAGLLGLLVLLINYFVEKRRTEPSPYPFFKLSCTLLAANIIGTTINTFLLMWLYNIQKAFLLFYLPRLSEEIAVSLIFAYVFSLFLPRLSKIMQ